MTTPPNPTGPKTRRPRFARDPHAGRNIKSPSELDLAIYEHLDNARFLTIKELCELLDNDYNRGYVKDRLTYLFHNAGVDRPPLQDRLDKIQGTNSILCALGPTGAGVRGIPVKKNNALRKVSNLEHKRMIARFYTRLYTTCRDSLDVELREWQFEPRGMPVWIPERHNKERQNQDARFVLLMEGRRGLFFHEAETGENSGTRTDWNQTSFWKKIRYYMELWYQCRRDYERDKSPYNTFLVLTTLPEKKKEHLEYLMELCRQADPKKKGLGIFWFTYMERIESNNPLRERIWVKPDPADTGLYAIV
jgi:hypothetical protein